MESAALSEMDLRLDVARVLAAASAHGHRVQLLECKDGSLVITCYGANQAVFRVGICNLELCIKSYLALLGAFEEVETPVLPAPIPA